MKLCLHLLIVCEPSVVAHVLQRISRHQSSDPSFTRCFLISIPSRRGEASPSQADLGRTLRANSVLSAVGNSVVRNLPCMLTVRRQSLLTEKDRIFKD